MRLMDLKYQVLNCKKCPLWETRKNPVFGEGNPNSEIMLIGEAPGRREDEIGRPFVGQAGKLLDEIFREIGLSREDVYITNVVKCRPPGNRQPTKREVKSCSPYLDKQIMLIRPKVIIAMGNTAASYIMDRYNMKFTSMRELHGKVFRVGTMFGELKVLMTYHPAAALRNPELKEVIKEDLMRL